MNNKILKAATTKTCNPLLIALILQLPKVTMNLTLSAAPLVTVEFTTCLVLLVTSLLYTKLNTLC